MKTCSKCKTEKPLDSFSINARAKDGRHWWCRECCAVWYQQRKASMTPEQWDAHKARRRTNMARMRANDPASQAMRHMRKRLAAYDLDLSDFIALWTKQDGKCGICRIPFDQSIRNAVDHDHKTNAVRGILCIRCNTMIGQARDDTSVLRAAIRYLERNRP